MTDDLMRAECSAGDDPLRPLRDLPADADVERIEAALRAVAGANGQGDALARETLRERLIAELKRRKCGSPARLVDAALGEDVGGKSGEPDGLQGQAVVLDAPQPSSEPVDGAKLLDELVETARRFVHFESDAGADTTALWIAFTYTVGAASISPRLAVTSPTRRCGKTTLLSFIGALALKPLPTSNTTTAAVFRSIEQLHPTLLIDEMDTFLNDDSTLHGILNAGHARANAFVLRTVGDNHEPRRFDVWAATCVAKIGTLPSTLADRAIEVRMGRKPKGVAVERWRIDRSGHFEPLRSRLMRWSNDHLHALRDADPEVPSALHDRAADNWRVLLSIADEVGGDWPERARRAALALSGAALDEDDFLEALLRDIFAAFKRADEDDAPLDVGGGRVERLPTPRLIQLLRELPESRWVDYARGNGLTPARLAVLLRRFDIHPKQLWVDGVNCRGYERSDFVEAWGQYLGAQPEIPAPHPLGTLGSPQTLGARPVSDPLGVASPSGSETPAEPHEHRDPSGLAGRNPPEGALRGIRASADQGDPLGRAAFDASIVRPTDEEVAEAASLFSGSLADADALVDEAVGSALARMPNLAAKTERKIRETADWLGRLLDRAGKNGIPHEVAYGTNVSIGVLDAARRRIGAAVVAGRWFAARADPFAPGSSGDGQPSRFN
ncbi:DUF3631 domain-containing protein [Candidatus Poribacteria bacterium]|nr:DUF3631 domain-containing protein [Candidatus Poribacteria bacterium]